MGLAASQAKLLSITTRLSDNELRSQTLTAAKMALSNQTSAASKKYINALNSTELLYGTYDMNGNKTTVALTGTALSEYAPLKNQYALINSAGQVLVSETQAKYYEKSQNINDYLAFNGIDRIDTGETRTVTNPAYQDAYDDWKKKHDSWVENYPNTNDFTMEVPDTNNEIYNAVKNSGGCFGGGMSGSNCYMHVLSDLIGPGTVTTSDGHTYTVAAGSWSWNSSNHSRSTFDPITAMLKEGYCSGDVIEGSETVNGVTYSNAHYENVEYNGITKSMLVGNVEPSDPNMTLWQRAIDLLWEVHSDYDGSSTGGTQSVGNFAKFLYYVEHDLKQAITKTVFDEDAYNDAVEKYPPEPTLEVPPTIDEIVYEYSDADKAQWYVNLWHRMNGASDEKDGNQTTTTTNTTGYWNEMIHNETTSTTQRWAVLEDGLMNSSKWLQNALTQGTVTLEQVQYTGESTESNTGLENVSWKSIIYSSAQDITEQTDETAIAKAEAEYERAQNDIEAKDKQFDNMLKLLDTEHEALQTEYESVQQVINKNISRTLKIYSA